MSRAIEEPAAESPAPVRLGLGGDVDWSLVGRQLQGILRIELRRNLKGRRALVLYFVAFGPVLITTLWALLPLQDHLQGPQVMLDEFAEFFAFYLKTSVFLSALILFMSLFRSEILQKSLHYYLLTPVRREVLVAGKYLAALLASTIVFSLATAALFFSTFSPWGLGPLSRFLFQGSGLGNLIAYIGIAVLGCVGYGAVFLLMGLFLRNPVVAAVIIWGWESINFLLPAWLKKLSVVFYLESLYPIPRESRLLAVLADPTPAWLSVPGLLLFTAFVLALASWRARRMQLDYGDD